jgi:hypothetical protein
MLETIKQTDMTERQAWAFANPCARAIGSAAEFLDGLAIQRAAPLYDLDRQQVTRLQQWAASLACLGCGRRYETWAHFSFAAIEQRTTQVRHRIRETIIGGRWSNAVDRRAARAGFPLSQGRLARRDRLSAAGVVRASGD